MPEREVHPIGTVRSELDMDLVGRQQCPEILGIQARPDRMDRGTQVAHGRAGSVGQQCARLHVRRQARIRDTQHPQ